VTYRGQVKDGVVVPESGVELPEGAEVRIELEWPQQREATTKVNDGGVPSRATMYERYRNIIGAIKDLPPDFAANHDHYIHGQPKRQ
jgi:hypothetical protein